jgi:AcrR family transcriptional regulator
MIRAATNLFHQRGVKGTSIDQVLAQSGTGKSQFTHYFRNKQGLVRAVVESLQLFIKSGQAPTGYDLRSWSDFERWFARYIDFQKSVHCELSCPLGTIGADLGEDQELVRREVSIFFEWCAAKLTQFFLERKVAGDLVRHADPKALADLCLTVMEGGMLMTKIGRSTSIFENAADQTLAYIRGLRTSTREGATSPQ